MIDTKRQLGRRELARRLFIQQARTETLARAELAVTNLDGRPLRRPACADALAAEGIAWGRLAEQDGSVLIRLARAPDPALLRAGLESVRTDDLDFDRLLPPWTDAPAGHFSYAHKRQHAACAFDTAYDPFDHASNTDWTGYAIAGSGDDYFQSAAGALTCKAHAGTTRAAAYRWDATPMDNVSADYSVEADTAAYTDASSKERHFGVCARVADGGNFYMATWFHDAGSGNWEMQLYKRLSAAWTQLAAAVENDVTGLLRLEVVGSVLKGYIDSETESVSASDSDITAAGYPGVYGRQDGASTATAATLDNLTVYAPFPRSAAPPLGPLAARGQLRPALSR